MQLVARLPTVSERFGGGFWAAGLLGVWEAFRSKVETKLAVRVQRQVMDRMNTTAALIPEDDVTALAMISSALRDQLMYQIRVPHILGPESGPNSVHYL
eukprot:5190720-Amphidinium_carterae.1